MTGWQVVRLHQGAATVCCTHRYEQVASFCADWRDRIFIVGDRADGSWHDIRPEPEETR